MSIAAPTIGPVRAAWGGVLALSVTARRVGTAITELLDWKTWSSPEPLVMDDARRGITRQRIAERAAMSVRTVTRGLAELRLSGLVEVTRRRWLQSWYRLDAPRLITWAMESRAERREARLRTILGDAAPVASAPPPMGPGAEALARAAMAQPRAPGWSQHSRRPDDLARLVWVWAATLHGERAAERLGSYSGRMEALRRAYRVGDELPLERFAEQLVMVATWLRHDGRMMSRREQRRATPIPQRVAAYDVLRPRVFAAALDVAEAWHRDEHPRDMEALAEQLVTEHGAPETDAAAHRLYTLARQRGGLSMREESTLLHALLARVPHRVDDEPEPEDPEDPEDPVAELDPAWLARLALAVPEVEALKTELAALAPAPAWEDPIFRRPTVDPERRRAAAQKHLRTQLDAEIDGWLSRARQLLDAPAEGSPAVLHDLAEALARLRELSGRLAR